MEDEEFMTTDRASIRQVAVKPGFSVSAMSKVLQQAYGMSPALRAPVLAAMDELR